MPDVVLGGQSWHYATWGRSQNPPIVLLHGFTGSHESWAQVADRWSDDYWIVAPDLPGHGRTPAPEDPQELAFPAAVGRLDALLSHISIDKAAVIGYSMGGRLALSWAVRSGQRIAALVLESASPGLDDAAERTQRQQHDRMLADAIEARGLSWFVPHWAGQPLFHTQSAALRARDNKIRAAQNPFGLAQSLRGAGTGAQEPLWTHLSGLAMPVLLITGGLDSKFRVIAERMASAIPQARCISVAGAGHVVHGEQPDQFDELVRNFFNT